MGYMIGTDQDAARFRLVPSGNHRNQQRVQLAPGKPSQRGQVCPRCKGRLNAFVQTFPTQEYVQWREAAQAAILARYSGQTFNGPVVVFAWVYGGRGFMESRDWDNVQKCVGDVLTDSGVMPAPGGTDAVAGGDDVRSLKGWRTWYLTRGEHAALVGGKPDQLQARLFVQLVEASKLQPFTV